MKYILLGFSLLGVAVAIPDGKVVGGTVAKQGDFTYVAALKGPTGAIICGGAIINSRWVISAAYCSDKGDLTSVGVGSNTLKKQTNYAIDNAIPHPNYNNDVSGLNDILLVKTSTDIVTKPGAVSFATINPLSLPEAAAQNVRFAGWGQLHASSSQYPADLYAVNYTLLPPSSCWKKSKQKLLYSSQIQLCASSTGGACWGDNGGPLVAQNGMLIGLESKVMGPTCAAGNPDVFTKVAYYYDWLFDVISNN